MYGLMGGMYGLSKRPRMTESNLYFADAGFPVVRPRGLPFTCTDADIFRFFAGLELVDLLMLNNKSASFSGEAFVVFSRPVQADIAVRHNMGRGCVQVFKCKKHNYYNAVAAESGYDLGHYDNSPSRSKKVKDKDRTEYTEILKLRGLPFTVTRADIAEFFKDFNVAEEKVHIACRPDGKVTGEAYVAFESAEVAKQAMCKDRLTIGTRYVELFRSTPGEARRAESRSWQ